MRMNLPSKPPAYPYGRPAVVFPAAHALKALSARPPCQGGWHEATPVEKVDFSAFFKRWSD